MNEGSSSSSGQEHNSCSVCHSLGVPCRVTPTTKRQNGLKRQRMLGNGETSIEKSNLTKSQDTSNSASPSINSIDKMNTAFLNHTSSLSNSTVGRSPKYSRIDHATSLDSSTIDSRPELMGISGLSVRALEDCVDAFFRYLGIWMEIRDPPNRFMKRFRLFLARKQGLEIEKVEGDDTLTAASEMLVLSVAARGASFTVKHAHLQDLLLDRISSLSQIPCRISQEGLDAIEGISLASEISFRTVYWDPMSQTPSCLRLNPLGKGIAAELCLFHRLNVEPPLSDPEYIGKITIFWTIFIHDALRSISAGRMYRIADEDIGWIDNIKPHTAPFIRLGYLARQLARSLLSQKSKRYGISLLDLKALLAEIEEYPAKVRVSMADLLASSAAWSHSPYAALEDPTSSKSVEFAKLIRGAVLMGLWLRISLNVWMQIKERKYPPESEEAVMVDELMKEASEHVITLAQICTDHNLVEYGPNVLLATFSAWMLYFMQKANEARTSDASSTILDLTEKVSILLQAIRSPKLHPDATMVADRLEEKWKAGQNVPMIILTRVAEVGTAILEDEGVKLGGQEGSNNMNAAIDERDDTGLTGARHNDLDSKDRNGIVESLNSSQPQTVNFPIGEIPQGTFANLQTPSVVFPDALDIIEGEQFLRDDDWRHFFQMCGFEGK